MEAVTATIAGETWRINMKSGRAISARLRFDGEHPRAFGIEPARAEVMEYAGKVADTHAGGTFNAAAITLNPHGNGTHTESAAHLVSGAPPATDAAPVGLVPCIVISVEPTILGESGESYEGEWAPDDRVLTAESIRKAADGLDLPDAFFQAVVLRTRPNTPDKLTRDYSGTNPPYPTAEALDWLNDKGVEHLLVDLPSLDREHDGGSLPNHRAFWGLPAAVEERQPPEHHTTITEMVYVPSELPDGPYALDLQVPDLALDASPSRPVLFGISRDRSLQT